MSEIWKYGLTAGHVQRLEMPEGATVLRVEALEDGVWLWALVNPKHPPETRKFTTYGTGHEIADDVAASDYVGTFFLRMLGLVFHVFESTT